MTSSSRVAWRVPRAAAVCVCTLAVLVLAAAVFCAGSAPGFSGPPVDVAWPPLELETSTRLAGYDIRVWVSRNDMAPGFYRVITIERDGVVLTRHDEAVGLGRLTGTDIDGSGRPNAIVECYSGGAHCCSTTYVYDLAEDLMAIELPPSPGGNAGADFVDLDGDGTYEVLTADDSFAYAYCSYAASPAVRVVLALDFITRRYVPASFRYPDLYATDIVRDTERAKEAETGDDSGWDGTPKCVVLPLILDCLYSGDADAAWRALDAYYPSPDREAFRAEIERTVGASPYFAVPSRP